MLEGERKAMSDFLKTEMRIDSLEIRFSVDKSRNNDDRPYTPSDKLKYMATKNPNLVDLVNKLDLELDF